jgi:hypothetical protein
VGGVTVDVRLDAVLLSLEQQIGHLPRSRVQQIDRQASIQRPHVARSPTSVRRQGCSPSLRLQAAQVSGRSTVIRDRP